MIRPVLRFSVAVAACIGFALLGAAGVSSTRPAARDFPQILTPSDNPTTPARIALGRILFFDPVLSNDNRTSCAHCHHPDLSFSDGLARARGYGADGAGTQRTGGVELPRRTQALWNVAYNARQYWDGRASTLEDQARFPITASDEMKQLPETLIAELKSIPEYAPLFKKAFGEEGEAMTFGNVCRALATFERTLVSKNSAYDRFVAGDRTALSSAAQRGSKLFFSVRTKCSTCHAGPNFTSGEFKVTGVPNVPGKPEDPHRALAAEGRGGGPNSAYRVPTLRNVALHPPYMHNGSLRSLPDVVEFYAEGGGRARGADSPNQDGNLRGFKINPAEKADLIAFLKSLTDVSAMPAIPKEVPSGLEVVQRIAPPSRSKR
jgi:cytochrome c peroxidase